MWTIVLEPHNNQKGTNNYSFNLTLILYDLGT